MSEISLGMVHKFCRQVGFKVKYIKIPWYIYIYEASSVWSVKIFQAHFLMKEGAEGGIGTKGMEKNIKGG